MKIQSSNCPFASNKRFKIHHPPGNPLTPMQEAIIQAQILEKTGLQHTEHVSFVDNGDLIVLNNRHFKSKALYDKILLRLSRETSGKFQTGARLSSAFEQAKAELQQSFARIATIQNVWAIRKPPSSGANELPFIQKTDDPDLMS
jgi:hypothetical protein